jgi:hypothetical protein
VKDTRVVDRDHVFSRASCPTTTVPVSKIQAVDLRTAIVQELSESSLSRLLGKSSKIFESPSDVESKDTANTTVWEKE